jgi:predicted Zn-ribbon and HTH transcriptional regulator
MLILEGLGAIVFGLWLTSQGTGPGDSIMIVLGLPVVLFGVVLTIIGFAKSIKESTDNVSEMSVAKPPGKHDPFKQKDQERQTKKNACPACGTKYRLIDRVTQPSMCAKCWKISRPYQ